MCVSQAPPPPRVVKEETAGPAKPKWRHAKLGQCSHVSAWSDNMITDLVCFSLWPAGGRVVMSDAPAPPPRPRLQKISFEGTLV